MRIGIDTHAAEDEGSGNSSYLRGLVPALADACGAGEELVLYAIRPEAPFYATLASRPRVTVRPLWPKPALLRIPLALAVASWRDRLDVLHVQYVGPPLHRGALVVTIHDLAFLRVPETFPARQRVRLRWQVRANARRAAAVITVSEHARRDIASTYRLPEDRITVVPNGVHARFAPARDPRAVDSVCRRLGVTSPYLLCVGRLNARKNLTGVLDAFERARRESGMSLQLVVTGRDEYRAGEFWSAVARSPVRDAVIGTGCVPEADLPALYSGAVALLYPSVYEGFGLPPLEAMACGTPVVAAVSTSLPEVVGDAGLLVDPRSPQELVTALTRLLADPELRAELSRRGLERAHRFTWAEASRSVLAVYRGVASPGRRE